MGLWLKQPKLEEGEAIRWQAWANRSLNRWIAAGGMLVVTNRRVLFRPNRVEMAIGKKQWECPIASLAEVEVVDRDFTVPAGGMRRRLGIRTSGGVELFVVNDVETKAIELREIFSDLKPAYPEDRKGGGNNGQLCGV